MFFDNLIFSTKSVQESIKVFNIFVLVNFLKQTVILNAKNKANFVLSTKIKRKSLILAQDVRVAKQAA